MFAERAIEWVARYLRRATYNGNDIEARYYMMLGASIAGIGFGHAGVHIPHAMAYPIAGMVKEWKPPDYPVDYPLVPPWYIGYDGCSGGHEVHSGSGA